MTALESMTTGEELQVSVVMPCLNEASTIAGCVDEAPWLTGGGRIGAGAGGGLWDWIALGPRSR